MQRTELRGIFFSALLLLPTTYAADAAPEPLSLEQALRDAEQHPRTELEADALPRHPPLAPLVSGLPYPRLPN